MKNAIIFHDTGCTPNSYWFPKTKKFLENLGYEVWVPQLPDADTPVLSKWLPVALSGDSSQKYVSCQGRDYNFGIPHSKHGLQGKKCWKPLCALERT